MATTKCPKCAAPVEFEVRTKFIQVHLLQFVDLHRPERGRVLLRRSPS